MFTCVRRAEPREAAGRVERLNRGHPAPLQPEHHGTTLHPAPIPCVAANSAQAPPSCHDDPAPPPPARRSSARQTLPNGLTSSTTTALSSPVATPSSPPSCAANWPGTLCMDQAHSNLVAAM